MLRINELVPSISSISGSTVGGGGIGGSPNIPPIHTSAQASAAECNASVASVSTAESTISISPRNLEVTQPGIVPLSLYSPAPAVVNSVAQMPAPAQLLTSMSEPIQPVMVPGWQRALEAIEIFPHMAELDNTQ